MRRFAIGSLLMVGLCGSLCLAAPRIAVDNSVYTADVQSGSTVSHVFTLSNTGDETLAISLVQTSCECATATLQKPDLAPGESIGLEVRVHTAGFSGTVEKTVEVESNDPANPSLVLQLVVTLLQPDRPQTPSSSAPAPAPGRAQGPAASSAQGASGATQSLGWPVVFGVALAMDAALVLLLFLLVSSGT